MNTQNADYVAVEVAKAALCEVGRADLAAEVVPNRAGVPKIERYHGSDRPIIARAFLLGHQAAGHDARLTRTVDENFEWVDGVRCSCADPAQIDGVQS